MNPPKHARPDSALLTRPKQDGIRRKQEAQKRLDRVKQAVRSYQARFAPSQRKRAHISKVSPVIPTLSSPPSEPRRTSTFSQVKAPKVQILSVHVIPPLNQTATTVKNLPCSSTANVARSPRGPKPRLGSGVEVTLHLDLLQTSLRGWWTEKSRPRLTRQVMDLPLPSGVQLPNQNNSPKEVTRTVALPTVADLADLAKVNKDISTWPTDYKTAIMKLRPADMNNYRYYRLRLRTRDGRSVFIRIPSHPP